MCPERFFYNERTYPWTVSSLASDIRKSDETNDFSCFYDRDIIFDTT